MEDWSSVEGFSRGDDLWGTQGDNLRAPIIPRPLAQHLSEISQDGMTQAHLLYFYAGARNHSAMGAVVEYLATYDLPLFLELEEQHREHDYMDGLEYLDRVLASKSIQGRARTALLEMQVFAAEIQKRSFQNDDAPPYNPYEFVVDAMVIPPVESSAEDWRADIASQACSSIVSIALHQNYLRHMNALARGGFSSDELSGACSSEDEAALAFLCRALWDITTYNGDPDEAFVREMHRERVYGAILGKVGNSLLDLLPLARLVEEYNFEWALAAFDWEDLGDGERLFLPFSSY